MADEQRKHEVSIYLTRAELDRIEKWWHERRLPSRGEAIRKLIELGLAVKPNGGRNGRPKKP